MTGSTPPSRTKQKPFRKFLLNGFSCFPGTFMRSLNISMYFCREVCPGIRSKNVMTEAKL